MGLLGGVLSVHYVGTGWINGYDCCAVEQEMDSVSLALRTPRRHVTNLVVLGRRKFFAISLFVLALSGV